MNWYILSVYIHILAAMTWIGGTLFLVTVLVPVARKLQPPEARVRLLETAGRKFLRIAWGSIGVLLITGVANLAHRGISPGEVLSKEVLDTEFGKILLIKLAMVFTTILLSVLHDFVLAPRVTRSMEAGGVSPLRRRLIMLARLNLLLALSIVALAVMLVRGLPW